MCFLAEICFLHHSLLVLNEVSNHTFHIGNNLGILFCLALNHNYHCMCSSAEFNKSFFNGFGPSLRGHQLYYECPPAPLYDSQQEHQIDEERIEFRKLETGKEKINEFLSAASSTVRLTNRARRAHVRTASFHPPPVTDTKMEEPPAPASQAQPDDQMQKIETKQ